MRMKTALIGITLIASVALCADFKNGQAVEAKRGEEWEPATVVRTDGPLVMVRYKDGKQLFVAADKLRVPGNAKGAQADPAGGVNASMVTDTTPDAVFDCPITPTGPEGRLLRPEVGARGRWKPIAAFEPVKPEPIVSKSITLVPGRYTLVGSSQTDALVQCTIGGESLLNPTPMRTYLHRVEPSGTVHSYRLPEQTRPLGLSPSSKLLLARSEIPQGGNLDRSRLDIFRLEASAVHVLSVQPFLMAPVTAATFADDEQVIVSSKEWVACWQIQPLKELWRIRASGGFAVSPDGKHAAVQTAIGVTLIDITTSAVAATLDAPQRSHLAFAPDGTMLYASTDLILLGWDLKTGAQTVRLGLPERFSDLVPIDRDIVSFDGLLISVSKAQPFWQNGLRDPGFGRRGWKLSDRTLTMFDTVPPEAQKALAELNGPEPAVRKGDSITVDFSAAECSPQTREKAVRLVTERLTKLGFTVKTGAPVRLVARTERGESTVVEYSGPGASLAGGKSVNETQRVFDVRLERNGVRLWGFRGDYGSALSTTYIKRGGSLQEDYENSVIAVANSKMEAVAMTEFPWVVGEPVDLSKVPGEKVSRSAPIR